MAYTTQTRLDSAPQGGWTRAAIEAEAKRRGAKRWDDLMDVFDVYWSQAALNREILAIQSAHETAWWTSYWWETRLNLAGIGITGDSAQNAASKTWTNGTAAAWAHVTHLGLYAFGEAVMSRLPVHPADDPRWDAAVAAGYAGTKPTLASLTNTWAIDSQYADKLVAILNQRPASTTTPPVGGTEGRPDVATKPYLTAIPGIPGGPVPTIAPVKIKLIPEWRTNNRPGIKARQPRRSVQHGNGNPNSTAEGEANYLYNGAGGRQASYHSSTDDKETWVMVPGDEVTWQAADGSGPGNMNGYSNEMVEDARLWADPIRRMRCIQNTADYMGTIAARLDIAKPERHWDFNAGSADRHDCPNKLKYTWINGRLAWDIYVDLWDAAKAAEVARMKGGDVPEPTPLPEYAKADPITELEANPVYLKLANGAELIRADWTVKAIKTTPRLRWATPGAASIGPDIDKGTTFAVSYLIINADGSRYLYTPWHTRVAFDDVEVLGAAEAAA